MMDEIIGILDSYHYSTLLDMAAAAGLVARGGVKVRKAELIATMRTRFFTRERIEDAFARLDNRERAVLDLLLRSGGEMPTRSLCRQAIRAEWVTLAPESERQRGYTDSVPYAFGYVGLPTRAKSSVFEDVVARLTLRGLVFGRDAALLSAGVPAKLQFHPPAVVFVPEVVRRYLPEPDPNTDKLASWQPERVEVGAPALLLRDLYLYWDHVRRNDVALLQSGLVGKRSLKAINNVLLVPDLTLDAVSREDETRQLIFLRLLLQGLDLVCTEGGHLRPVNRDALHVPEFWDRPQLEQLTACLRAWAQMEGFDVLGREAEGYGRRYARARQSVLAWIKEMAVGMWIEPAELLDRVQTADMDFLFTEHSRIEAYRGRWYHGYAGGYYSRRADDVLGRLDEFEASFVADCLKGFLFDIGLVEVGYNGESVGGFRVTPQGAAMLGNPPPDLRDESEPGRLIVQPNFQLVAIGPVSLALLARLDLFADREQADRGAFGYRLTRESLYRAQQIGFDAVNVIRLLQETSDTGVPQNVLRSLQEWSAHHERITFRTGVSLLQTDGTALLDELLNDAAAAPAIARAVDASVALVDADAVEQLIAALIERGSFPALAGPDPASADGSVTLDDDGTVCPVHAVAGLHLRGRLARMAETTADGGWQLTPESIRRAGGSKPRVVGVLEELARLHRGPLPQGWGERIKAWGGYYGTAAAEDLTLIEFRDPATLIELCEHPLLAQHLTPLRAGERAFAVVQVGALEKVRQTLSELGVLLRSGIKR